MKPAGSPLDVMAYPAAPQEHPAVNAAERERPAGQAEWLRAKIPAGRFAEVADVVELAVFLLGPNNTFVNGAIIPCDGGLLVGYTDGPPENSR
jgi:NAD(P)-dependent dehydrogenase (short-subunit alcohol dehydrogenase family)